MLSYNNNNNNNKKNVEILTPVPQNVALFRNRVFASVIDEEEVLRNRVTLRALCPLSLYEDSRRIRGTRAT